MYSQTAFRAPLIPRLLSVRDSVCYFFLSSPNHIKFKEMSGTSDYGVIISAESGFVKVFPAITNLLNFYFFHIIM